MMPPCRPVVKLLPLAGLLWGCAPSGDGPLPGDDTAVEPADDTGEPDDDSGDGGADSGDGGGDTGDSDPDPDDLIATVSLAQNDEIGTIFNLQWLSNTPVRTSAHTELDDGTVLETPWTTSPATSGTIELRGIPVSTRGRTWLKVETVEGGVGRSEALTFQASGPPASLPALVFTEGERPAAPGFSVVPLIADTLTTGVSPAVLILDEKGRLVWWRLLDKAFDNTAAALSRDGQWVYWIGEGALRRVRYDGSDEQQLTVPGVDDIHHHFNELPDGTIAFLGMEQAIGPDGITSYQSHTLVELDGDGGRRVVWSLAQDIERLAFGEPWPSPEEAAMQPLGNVNRVEYDEARGTYVLGLQSDGAVFAVDRGLGELAWWSRPADPADGVPFVGGPPWTATHGIELTADGFYVFVNTTTDSPCAHVAAVSGPGGDGALTETWIYAGGTCHRNPVLGEVHQVAPDVLQVTWSTSAMIEQIGLDGKLRSRIEAGFGQVFGYSDWVPDLYGG